MPRGGAREGAGRPKVEEKRKQRQLRATDDEWELIRRFSRILKYTDKDACKNFVDAYSILSGNDA